MLLNFGLLKNPINWLTVILMTMIGGIVLHLIMSHWNNNTIPAQT